MLKILRLTKLKSNNHVQTEGRKKKDAPIKSIHFNGKKIADYRISHNELIKGGELIYNYK